jgi:Glycosyltransferase family 87
MLPSIGPMPRHRLAVAAVAVSLLAAYAVLWMSVSTAQIGTSDFTATYVGGTLLREGHGAGIYDQSLQAHLYAALVPLSRGGSLGFVYPPPAAVLVLPLTLLPLTAAYRVYQVAQILMLVLGVCIAARAAPWPRMLARGSIPSVAALFALAGAGTFALGLLGQWDGVGALGLGGAYALWRRDARFAGGVVLAASAAVAKPHLALGLAALLIGWRERRVLAGAAAGVAAMILVSLAAVGPTGLAAFVASTQTDAGRWPLASMLGFTGLFGSWLGNGAAPQLLAAVGSVLALGACLWLGRRLVRDPSALEPCLAAAMLLSLVASPHLLSHDLVMLEPVLVGVLAWAGARDGSTVWPGPSSRAVLAGWGVLFLAAVLDLGSQTAAPPGRLVPLALLALAGLLVRELGGRVATASQQTPPPRFPATEWRR